MSNTRHLLSRGCRFALTNKTYRVAWVSSHCGPSNDSVVVKINQDGEEALFFCLAFVFGKMSVHILCLSKRFIIHGQI